MLILRRPITSSFDLKKVEPKQGLLMFKMLSFCWLLKHIL